MNTNIEATPTKPNLFTFATSELSQDAFLCWLLSWADGKYATADKALHETAVEFVQSIMEKHKIPVSERSFTIKIWRQYKYTDVLAAIHQGDKKYILLIEDKTETAMHGNQLARYKKTVEEDFPCSVPLMVYLKTGAIAYAAQVERAGYQVYSREALLDVLAKREQKITNDIFKDYYHYLVGKNALYEAFQTKKVDEWTWKAWEGFLEALQRQMLEEKIKWGYVANPAGGELVAYWGAKYLQGGGCVYLEIHKKIDAYPAETDTKCQPGRHFLAYKVSEVPDEKNKRTVRQDLHDRLMQSARKNDWGGNVAKPSRFGYGNSMVFCETTNQDCWLAKDPGGRLNMGKIAENLKKAESILSEAVKDIVCENR